MTGRAGPAAADVRCVPEGASDCAAQLGQTETPGLNPQNAFCIPSDTLRERGTNQRSADTSLTDAKKRGGPRWLAGPERDESPGGAFKATFPTEGRDGRELRTQKRK